MEKRNFLFWKKVNKTTREVATWPTWKRGDPEDCPPSIPVASIEIKGKGAYCGQCKLEITEYFLANLHNEDRQCPDCKIQLSIYSQKALGYQPKNS